VQDIADAYTESWRLGLKAVAIYRDGSKGGQPLNVSSSDGKSAKKIDVGSSKGEEKSSAETKKQLEDAIAAAMTQDQDAPPRAVRHRLPAERVSITHKFSIGGHEGYINVGLYKNGQPGELFIRMAKEGSTVSGLMDCFATAVSIALQHGVPLRLLCEKFSHTRFEPSGWTQNADLGFAKSIMDYIFRWLQLRFLTNEQQSLFQGLLKPKSDLYVGPGEAVDPVLNGAPASADQLSLRTTPPQEGIAPEVLPTTENRQPTTGPITDRSATHHVHTANALKGLVDMGDAPSCSTCGAIMTRNGSCYRCGECGSTSGCS
jgi:ribonucleoside-diphosphate reductase alpha chain